MKRKKAQQMGALLSGLRELSSESRFSRRIGGWSGDCPLHDGAMQHQACEQLNAVLLEVLEGLATLLPHGLTRARRSRWMRNLPADRYRVSGGTVNVCRDMRAGCWLFRLPWRVPGRLGHCPKSARGFGRPAARKWGCAMGRVLRWCGHHSSCLRTFRAACLRCFAVLALRSLDVKNRASNAL